MACTRLRLAAWLTLSLFFIGFVLFFVSYVGHDWYVVPDERAPYPPRPSSTYGPDSPQRPIKLGLFWMCVGGHCKYDLRVDYMIVKYLPYADITYSFQQYRTAVMAISTVAAAFCLISLAMLFLFLSGFWISRYIGFVAGGTQLLAGIAQIVAIIIFGSTFRGSTVQSPFGWSFGLMIVAVIIIIASGIITVLLSVTIHVRAVRQASRSRSMGKVYTEEF